MRMARRETFPASLRGHRKVLTEVAQERKIVHFPLRANFLQSQKKKKKPRWLKTKMRYHFSSIRLAKIIIIIMATAVTSLLLVHGRSPNPPCLLLTESRHTFMDSRM